jgi:hypothetical protein
MLSFGFARLPLTWRELLTRTIKEFAADNELGLCRGAGLLFLLRHLPAVLVAIAFASFFPLEHFVDRIVGTLGGIVPGGVIRDPSGSGAEDLGRQARTISNTVPGDQSPVGPERRGGGEGARSVRRRAHVMPLHTKESREGVSAVLAVVDD